MGPGQSRDAALFALDSPSHHRRERWPEGRGNSAVTAPTRRSMKIERLTPQEKFELVIGSYQTDNVAEYCRQKGIDRSYLYQLRREHQAHATGAWEAKKPGRPPSEPENITPEQVRELEHQCESLKEELDGARFERALACLALKHLDRAGALDDNRVKKKFTKAQLERLSEMKLRGWLERELSSQND